MKDTLYDVAIIGGGPAGSSFATFARQRGLNVILFEKEKFPRDHIGESLIPFTYWKLKELGVLEDLKKFATYKPGVNFVDADAKKQSTWCFGKVLKDESQMAIHTLRAPFDKALLDNAKKLGAEVHEEHKVKEINTEDPSGNVFLKVENKEGENFNIKARFLIDASGQNSFMAKKLGAKIPYEGLDRVAFYSHWLDTKYDIALEQGLIKIIYLGGTKKGWIWVIPVGRNHLSVGVSLNNDYVREQKAKFTAAGSSDWIKDFYLQELGYAPHLTSILENAKMEHEVTSIGDYSYYVEKKYGKNYAMIGDAGAFLDPIFSSGVYVALETAGRVVNAVNTTLVKGYEEGEKAFIKEFETIEGGYKLIEKFVRLFYSPELLNFAHANPSDPKSYEASIQAYSVFHYLLAGNFFENHKLYSEVIDSINSEKTYNRFISLIRKENNDPYLLTDCGFNFENIYGHLPLTDQVAEVRS